MPVAVAVTAPAELAGEAVVTGVRTLVVDHDVMVARIHRGFTERVPGFDVVDVAHSGAEALAAVDRLRPELVLLDVYLSDVSGLAVLRALRRREPPVDVLVVTASGDVAALRAAMEDGALRAMVKPFDFARFRQTLECYRRSRRRRPALAVPLRGGCHPEGGTTEGSAARGERRGRGSFASSG